MKLSIINRFFIINLAAILLLGLFQVQAQTKVSVKTDPKTQPVSTSQRETIETIIREYLLKNPTVIREAMLALQVQEEKERQQSVANNMKELKSDIYSDPDSPIVGNPKGDVTIVVFFDYYCGYCKKTLPGLKTLLSNDASVRVVYKEFPIMGPQSQVAARAALAAKRQGKYSEFHNALLESDGASDEVIKNISDRLGLNYATLKKDMDDPKINEAIERNIRLATAIGINGTPAYFIGEQFIPGAIDSASLAKAVSDERAKLVNVTITKGNVESKK